LRDYASRVELPEKVLEPAFETFMKTKGRMGTNVPVRPGNFF